MNSSAKTVHQMLEALNKVQGTQARIVGASVDGKTAVVVLLPVELTPGLIEGLVEGLAVDLSQVLALMRLPEPVRSFAITSVGLVNSQRN
jgi:hypothetical protein